MSNPDQLAAAVTAGDRRALAQAITLAESMRDDHRAAAMSLLEQLVPAAGQAVRLGVSGAPGVGKSTFIEAVGLHAIDRGHHVAVLTIDPSSATGGGSILGDKVRMERLAQERNAFIRPSPSGQSLGGVARRTREAVALCEAAGFDVVIVETVGVGQSETLVADMTDLLVLLILPDSGDTLQGIKRGITELADLVLVNKADGERTAAAQRSVLEYRAAIELMQPRSASWVPTVNSCSAETGDGISAAWQGIQTCHSKLLDSGDLAARRAAQAWAWMWSEANEMLRTNLKEHPEVRDRLPGLEAAVICGALSPAVAARLLLDGICGPS